MVKTDSARKRERNGAFFKGLAVINGMRKILFPAG